MKVVAEFHLPIHHDVLAQQSEAVQSRNPVTTAGHTDGDQAHMRKRGREGGLKWQLLRGFPPAIFPGFTQIFAFFMWKTQSFHESRAF